MKTDVLVVGGGPAGLSAARSAADSGVELILLEREVAIGERVRTSGATTVEVMRRFDIPPALCHQVDRLRILAPRERAEFSLPSDLGCIIDVRGVYGRMAEMAEKAGAVVLTNHIATRVITDAGRVVGCEVRTEAATFPITARVVIDATGYRATLSKQAGLHSGFRRFGVGSEYELITNSYDQKQAVLIVGDRYAPAGAAWVFPWGKGRVRIGVGVLHADTRANPRKHLDLLLEDAAYLGIDITGHEIVERHRGLIPSEGLPRQFTGDGIMAIGDAAGHPSLVVGEGIRVGLLSGEYAGQVAASSVKKGDTSRDALVAYERWFRQNFEASREISFRINRKMAGWDDGEWDELIRLLQPLPTQLLIDFLQSKFAPADIVRWAILHPVHWPRMARYAMRHGFDSFLLTRTASSSPDP